MADDNAIFYEQATHPDFLPQDSPYKIWIFPLRSESGSQADRAELQSPGVGADTGGVSVKRAVVGVLLNRTINYTITPSQGWGPFREMSVGRISKYLQFGQSLKPARDLWNRLKREGEAFLGPIAALTGTSEEEVSGVLAHANKLGAVGTDLFSEQIYRGGHNYLGIQGLEMLFRVKNDARTDVHVPITKLALISAQRMEGGFVFAPYKIAIRIGHYGKPVFRLDRAVLHSLAIEKGSPRDPDGYPTWAKATFTIESARVVTDKLIKTAFGVKEG